MKTVENAAVLQKQRPEHERLQRQQEFLNVLGNAQIEKGAAFQIKHIETNARPTIVPVTNDKKKYIPHLSPLHLEI